MNLLEKKPEESIPENIQDNIELISFNNFKPSIVGSSSLKSQLYSVDIDLYSIIKYKSLNNAKESIENNFKKIVKRIALNKDVYFMDFKLGYNNILYQNFKTKDEIKKFYITKKEYLTDKQFEIIQKLDDLDELKEYTRKLYTLRWTPKEIIQGYKIINKNEKKTISESLDDKSVIKIDIIAWLDGEFIEMTNLFEFFIKNKPLNIEEDSNIIKSIKEDIIFYYEDKNYIKMLKRIFAISKIKKDTKNINKLVEIFNSNVGLLYQIYSNLGSIKELIDRLNETNLNKIRERIINFIQLLKGRLGNIYEFEIPLNYYSTLDKISKIKNFNTMKEKIDKLMYNIKLKLNKQTMKLIKNYKINFRKYLK